MTIDPHDEHQVRLSKLEKLREQGIQVYPEKFEKKNTCAECLSPNTHLAKVGNVSASAETREDVLLQTAGRIMSKRVMGKIVFAHIQDPTGRVQAVIKEDEVGIEQFQTFADLIDVGDFIGVSGIHFITKSGQASILVKRYTFLGKALRPIPNDFYGLEDQETKYRQRYLDLIANRETFNRFVFRSNFTKLLREFYWKEGFIEVETSTLGNTASGALATPFSTHHNALDIDMYLRIAIETPQKELIVGGFEKTFEIGKVFRNEGVDPSHLQEFTAMEHYAAYWNYRDNMRFTEKMLEFLLNNLYGTTKVTIPNKQGELVEVDFAGPWPEASFRDLIFKDSGIDIYVDNTTEKLKKIILEKGIKIEHIDTFEFGNLTDALYKKVSRPHLIGPLFITKHPIEVSPLARKNDENPMIVDRFQLIVAGWEIVNAYSELVDPIDQKQRFEDQSDAQEKGDSEAHGKDDEYVKSMEYGMPPISGWGMGIDRIVALLTHQGNLRDVIFFPPVRPEKVTSYELRVTDKRESTTIDTPPVTRNSPPESLPDETKKRFIAVLNKKIPTGRLMNALGHMSAGLTGGRGLSEKGTFLPYKDKDESIEGPISHFPFIVLSADNSNQLKTTLNAAKELGISYTFFTDTMTIGGSDPQLKATAEKTMEELEFYGICLFGETEQLKPLTKKFSLFQ